MDVDNVEKIAEAYDRELEDLDARMAFGKDYTEAMKSAREKAAILRGEE